MNVKPFSSSRRSLRDAPCHSPALVVAGPEGLAAGVIAERMGVSATNVSFHLKELERSRLISSERESRSIIYSASYDVLPISSNS